MGACDALERAIFVPTSIAIESYDAHIVKTTKIYEEACKEVVVRFSKDDPSSITDRFTKVRFSSTEKFCCLVEPIAGYPSLFFVKFS